MLQVSEFRGPGSTRQRSRRRRRVVTLLAFSTGVGLAVLGGQQSESRGFVSGPLASPVAVAVDERLVARQVKPVQRRLRQAIQAKPPWDDFSEASSSSSSSAAEEASESEDGDWLKRFGTQLAVLLSVGTVSALVVTGGFNITQSSIANLGPSQKTGEEQIFEQWYARAAEASKKATRVALRAQESYKAMGSDRPKSGPTLVSPSVVERLRSVSQVLDTCQQDMYDEFWEGLSTYPSVLRGYIPLFSYYTDSAYPSREPGSADEQLRLALKYEVGSLTRSLHSFDLGIEKRSIRDVEKAFAEMSLSYDRYLKAGNLYAGYDPVTSTTVFYEGIEDSRLVYTPLSLEQPRIRDEVLVIQGPDKGKVGQVIWLGKQGPDFDDPGKITTATVKLSPNPILSGGTGPGIREVKAYPYSWIAVTRTSEQSFTLDLLLGSSAAIFSCALTYPLDSLKSRIQAKLPLLPPEGIGGLFNGLSINLLKEVPNMGLYMACFNSLTRQFCLLPFVDANNPSLKLLVMIPAGVLGFLSGSFIRAPFELLNRKIQTGEAASEEDAIQQVFFKPSRDQVIRSLTKVWILCVLKGIPFGALQCTFYELFKDRLELFQYGVPIALQPFIWGALAGGLTGLITNPPDVVLARLSANEKAAEEDAIIEADASNIDLEHARKNEDILAQIWEATASINEEEGPGGYFVGAGARALYFAPEACLWFAAYEFLRSAADVVSEM